MKKSVTLTLLSILFAFNALHTLAFAEEINQTTSPIIVEPPTVTLADPTLKPITLSALNIETQIIANIATSTYELVFHNPNARVLEGELLFSLLDGQQVIDYALPINGIYRHASVVPKAKGKEAYESTIRAQIDPALLEKTIGNNFKTRLYPLPANGYKKVKITLQELLKNKQNKLQYRVPFITKHALDSLKLNITIPALNSQPSANIADIQFDNISQGQSIKLEKSAFKISKPILITLDNSNNKTNTPFDTFVQQRDKETFLFSSSNFPQQTQPAPRPLPKKIALIWDTSFSNQQRQLDKELRFLASYIEQVKTATIELVFFNHAQTSKQSLTICAATVPCESGQPFSTLSKLLKNSHYNGSNNFASIDISQLHVDEVLLFSNGIKTLFDGELQHIDKPISSINASTTADTALLRRYATRSNGRFIDLVQHTTQEALQQLSTTQSSINVAASSANIDTDSIFVSQHNNRLQLIAKAKQALDPNQPAWVTLNITTQNKTQQKTIQLNNPIVVKHSLDSLWATAKIAALETDYKNNKDTIIALAKRYKVLTKDTSLIVLDRVEDYVRYEIEPPETLKPQYAKLLKQKMDKKLYEKEEALIESIQLLQEQKVWYNTTFAKTKPQPPKPKNKQQEADGSNTSIETIADIGDFSDEAIKMLVSAEMGVALGCRNNYFD